MKAKSPTARPTRTIALVAHDNKKSDLLEWATFNRGTLARHRLYATGTTGRMIHEALALPVERLQSGPLGGDQQVGSLIVDGKVDFLIFFWDPLAPQPHDPDVKALLRLAVVWNVPVACNRATADFLISSPLLTAAYERTVPDYTAHLQRATPATRLPAEATASPPRAADIPTGERGD
jgi:methylglyoxal synthase